MKAIPYRHEGNAEEEAQGSPKLSHQGGQRVNLYKILVKDKMSGIKTGWENKHAIFRRYVSQVKRTQFIVITPGAPLPPWIMLPYFFSLFCSKFTPLADPPLGPNKPNFDPSSRRQVYFCHIHLVNHCFAHIWASMPGHPCTKIKSTDRPTYSVG